MAVPRDLLARAISFAARAHDGHLRKDGRTPYFAHPVRVMMRASDFGVRDVEVLAAAVLHDTLEDTRTDWDDLAREFTPRVADLVAVLSKDPRLPEARREAAYFAGLHAAEPAAQLCKLCDTLDNLLECNGLSDSGRSRALVRANELLALLDAEFDVTFPGARAALVEAIASVRSAHANSND